MANAATLSFDNRANKWIASYAGKVLAASPNKDYVISVIASGRCNKAVKMGVSQVREIGKAAGDVAENGQQATDRFGINERFDFLSDFVNMVADRTCASLIITGEGGLGKTYTVNRTLARAGLTNAADAIGLSSDNVLVESQSRKVYSVIKGFSTPKGLYRTLYENRNRIIVFDDCDSVLKDPVALNLLKGALDSYDKRIISWNAESFGDDDLPRSFEFKGGVIFISNLPLFKIDQAIRSRAICVDLSMNVAQKLERMRAIIMTEEFLPEYSLETKQSALSFLDKMKEEAKELSLRTLISVTKVAARGDGWERRAEYLLTAN